MKRRLYILISDGPVDDETEDHEGDTVRVEVRGAAGVRAYLTSLLRDRDDEWLEHFSFQVYDADQHDRHRAEWDRIEAIHTGKARRMN